MTYEQLQEFERFWNFYDKKAGKIKAQKLWGRLTKKEIEAIRSTVRNYKESTPDKQYRKDPCTYLRNKSWLDDIDSGQKKTTLKAPVMRKLTEAEEQENVEIRKAYARKKAAPKVQRPGVSHIKQHIINVSGPIGQQQAEQIKHEEAVYKAGKKAYFEAQKRKRESE